MHAIVTGANSGVGFYTVQSLIESGYEVTLAVRSLTRGAEAAERLIQRWPNARVSVELLDLASLSSIESFAERMRWKDWRVLVNNAGAKIERPYKTTRDGFEWHKGVNHLGHFALTARLWPSKAPMAKIVTISSVVARSATLELANSDFETFDEGRAYADSKLLNLMFSSKLAKLIDQTGSDAASVAAHPGFARAEPYGTKIIRAAELALAQSAEEGSRCTIAALSQKNGSYVGPKLLQLWGRPTLIGKPSLANDENALNHYWDEAEVLTGLKFEV